MIRSMGVYSLNRKVISGPKGGLWFLKSVINPGKWKLVKDGSAKTLCAAAGEAASPSPRGEWQGFETLMLTQGQKFFELFTPTVYSTVGATNTRRSACVRSHGMDTTKACSSPCGLVTGRPHRGLRNLTAGGFPRRVPVVDKTPLQKPHSMNNIDHILKAKSLFSLEKRLLSGRIKRTRKKPGT